MPAVTRPICLIEEYAIKALISVWRKHSILATQAPQILRIKIGDLHKAVTLEKLNETRNNPYLPSFKRTPARIIEPATGAST